MSRHSKQLALNVRRRIGHHKPAKLWFKYRPGRASEWLCPDDFPTYLKKYPDVLIILYERESAGEPNRRNNLKVQDAMLRDATKECPKNVIAVFREITSGWADRDVRPKLLAAIKLAHQQKKPITIVLAIAANRFLRHEYFTPVNQLLPTSTEWKIVKGWAESIPLVTLYPPDMSESEIKSRHVKWGQKIKDKKGGRPKDKTAGYKKQRRIEMSPQVLKLYRKGVTVYRINKMTGIACSTIRDWLRKDDD